MNLARIRKSKAFTMIELIVVIVIMGILVAIGAFAYTSFINSSNESAVAKTGAQIAKTIAADSATSGNPVSGYTESEINALLEKEDMEVTVDGTDVTYTADNGCDITFSIADLGAGQTPTVPTKGDCSS